MQTGEVQPEQVAAPPPDRTSPPLPELVVPVMHFGVMELSAVRKMLYLLGLKARIEKDTMWVWRRRGEDEEPVLYANRMMYDRQDGWCWGLMLDEGHGFGAIYTSGQRRDNDPWDIVVHMDELRAMLHELYGHDAADYHILVDGDQSEHPKVLFTR